MCSHRHPFYEHRQDVDVGSTIARSPLSRWPVAVLSSPSWFRAAAAALRVAYGGEMAYSVPSGLRAWTCHGAPRLGGVEADGGPLIPGRVRSEYV